LQRPVKAKVTLFEANKMGGDCLNLWSVFQVRLDQRVRKWRSNAPCLKTLRFRQQSEPTFSFKKVIARVHDVISKIEAS